MSTAAAFIIAALSGLGVGSGGLLVIYLTLVENVDQLTAQGANLIFFILSSLASLILSLPKRKIPAGAVFIMIAFGICGSFIGTQLAPILPAAALRKIFGGMLVISGLKALKVRKKQTRR